MTEPLNHNGRKKNDKKNFVSYAELPSQAQQHLRHYAPDPVTASDAEIKAYWSEFRLRFESPTLDLNVPLRVMRRIIKSAKTELLRMRGLMRQKQLKALLAK